MATFGTNDLKNLPRQIADGMVKKTQTSSVVAKLSAQEPMRFGDVDIVTFNDLPKAEFIGEGANKSSTKGGFGTVTAKPRKAQVTMRFNQEVQWADEDWQLQVLSSLSQAGATALSRALDLGVFYRRDPLSGAETSWSNYLNTTTNRHDSNGHDGKPDLVLEDAVGSILSEQHDVNGIAFDPTYSWTLATARDEQGRKLYPDLGFGTDIPNFGGITVATGNTVSGKPEVDDDGVNAVKAIIGDYQSGIRWGIQRQIPVELIEFGDPDGNGDLKRKNQIALRLEILYAWYVFDDRFAVIEDQSEV